MKSNRHGIPIITGGPLNFNTFSGGKTESAGEDRGHKGNAGELSKERIEAEYKKYKAAPHRPKPDLAERSPFSKDNIGTIKWVNGTKGFGFIKDSVITNDIFVHVSELPEGITGNSTLKYDVFKTEKGYVAENISIS